MTPKTYVFFGNVGAGKGTQVELVKKILQDGGRNVVYLSPGVEYRAMIQSGNYTGNLVKDILNAGKLLPDFLTVGVYANALIAGMTLDSCLIADGYPRTIYQAEAFVASMDFYGRNSVELVYIEVSKEEVIKRMKLRGRSDDTDAGIAARFDVYENDVLPAMNVLVQKGYNLHTINGEQSIEAVHAEIKKALEI